MSSASIHSFPGFQLIKPVTMTPDTIPTYFDLDTFLARVKRLRISRPRSQLIMNSQHSQGTHANGTPQGLYTIQKQQQHQSQPRDSATDPTMSANEEAIINTLSVATSTPLSLLDRFIPRVLTAAAAHQASLPLKEPLKLKSAVSLTLIAGGSAVPTLNDVQSHLLNSNVAISVLENKVVSHETQTNKQTSAVNMTLLISLKPPRSILEFSTPYQPSLPPVISPPHVLKLRPLPLTPPTFIIYREPLPRVDYATLLSHKEHGVDATGLRCVWDSELTMTKFLLTPAGRSIINRLTNHTGRGRAFIDNRVRGTGDYAPPPRGQMYPPNQYMQYFPHPRPRHSRPRGPRPYSNHGYHNEITPGGYHNGPTPGGYQSAPRGRYGPHFSYANQGIAGQGMPAPPRPPSMQYQRERNEPQVLRVIELGAGMAGLAGLSIASLGLTHPEIFSHVSVDVLLTDGHPTAVFNNAVSCHLTSSLSPDPESPSNIRSAQLLWSLDSTPEVAALTKRGRTLFNIALVSDCLHFQQSQSALLATLSRVLSIQGVAILIQPPRADSLQNFKDLLLIVNKSGAKPLFQVSLLDRFDATLDKAAEAAQAANTEGYNPDVHLPKALILTKIRDFDEVSDLAVMKQVNLEMEQARNEARVKRLGASRAEKEAAEIADIPALG